MKQLRQCFFVQVGADYTQAAGIVGTAVPDDDLAGDIVELEPFAGRVLQDALGPEDPAVLFFVGELSEDGADFILFIALRGLQADVAEHLVRVMLPFTVVVMVMMMFVTVIMLMMMFMFMFVFVIIVIIVVIVIIVFMIVVVMMFVMVMMFMFIVIVIVVIILILKGREVQRLAVLNDFQHEIRLHVIPGGGDDPGVRMRFGDQQAALFHPVGIQQLGAAEDDG